MAIKKRLGEMLVEAGVIDSTQLHAALGHQRQWGGRLGACLVELKLASEESIVDALALKFGFEIARLDRIEHYAFEQARSLVPYEYAIRNRIFPLSADTSTLTVAMSDPTNLSLTDELAFRTGRRIKVCIAGENAIDAALRSHYGEEGTGQREAIALDMSDDGAMEAVYDPIGATSSEQLDSFFDQPAPVPAPAAPSPARAPRGAPPAVRPPASRPRNPSELQLEDQKTESLPLQHLEPVEGAEEELQPLPLDAEAELTDAGGVPAPEEAAGTWDPGHEPAEPPHEPYAEPAAEPYAEPAAEPYAEAPSEPYAELPPEAYAEAAPPGAAAEGSAPPREWTEEELQLLEALDRFARGDDATPSAVSPPQLLAAVVRLMVRKQWITQEELVHEILHG